MKRGERMMSRIEKNKLNFTVALIAEFAATYSNQAKTGIQLFGNRFKGLVFLQKHYEVMHTQSVREERTYLKLYQWYAVGEMEDNCNEAIPWFKKYGNRRARYLSRSKPFKDFGQGFYLSPGYEQAHALAKQKTDQLQSGEPCVTVSSNWKIK